MRVSVVMTVLDEKKTIRAALDALADQTRPLDEVIISDGGSRDGTVAIIREYEGRLPVRVVEVPGANISRGRNAAVREAAGEVIAVTDAGAWAEPDWLERLTAPFRQGASAVAGFFKADPRTPFEMALGATTLPLPEDIRPASYLPSSRSVAFRKSVWEAAGGYPEWLDFSEDVVFDLKVKEQCGPFVFVPDALVHFRPRPSLPAFFRQYYLYARGDGKAGLFTKIHAIRYFAYLVAGPLVAYAALTVSPWLWLLAVLGGAAYVRKPYVRLWRQWDGYGWADRAKLIAWVPVIRAVGDIAKMLGYPAGVVRRQKAEGRGQRPDD